MSDYFTSRKKQILKTFDDYPVVLVEIMCEQPEWNGRIVAISENCGSFPSISQVIAAGIFEDGSGATFAVTAQCLDLMALKDVPHVAAEDSFKIKNVEENFGCFLALFLGAIAFIIGIFVWGFIE